MSDAMERLPAMHKSCCPHCPNQIEPSTPFKMLHKDGLRCVRNSFVPRDVASWLKKACTTDLVCVQRCLNSCHALVSMLSGRPTTAHDVPASCLHADGQTTLASWSCQAVGTCNTLWRDGAIPNALDLSVGPCRNPNAGLGSRKQGCPSSHRVLKQNMRTGATYLASGRATPPFYLELRLLSLGVDSWAGVSASSS